MKPTPLPNLSEEANGLVSSKPAPYGWHFFLSASSDESGPLSLIAVDGEGESRVYFREGYIPNRVAKVHNAVCWLMFFTGSFAGSVAAWMVL